MPDILSQLLLNATGGQEPNPPLPPQPPGYRFSMEDKPEHFVPKIGITDYRGDVDGRHNFTGRYPEHIINQIILESKKAGVDPKIALSIGLQETNLGNMSDGNPLGFNGQAKTLPNIDMSIDAQNSLVRESVIPQSLSLLRSKMNKYPENIEHGIQAYNGLGTPPRDLRGMYGLAPTAPLPTDFYGKRVLDLKANVIDKNPLLTEMINRVR